MFSTSFHNLFNRRNYWFNKAKKQHESWTISVNWPGFFVYLGWRENAYSYKKNTEICR